MIFRAAVATAPEVRRGYDNPCQPRRTYFRESVLVDPLNLFGAVVAPEWLPGHGDIETHPAPVGEADPGSSGASDRESFEAFNSVGLPPELCWMAVDLFASPAEERAMWARVRRECEAGR